MKFSLTTFILHTEQVRGRRWGTLRSIPEVSGFLSLSSSWFTTSSVNPSFNHFYLASLSVSLIVHNILPIDFHVRGVDYRSLLSVYKVYFAMIMLNGAIMFFYQVKAEKLNLATKMITYIISTIHILYEICFLMFLLSSRFSVRFLTQMTFSCIHLLPV